MQPNSYNSKSLEVWENWTDGYAKIQKNPAIFALTLLNLLRINQVNHLIDAGCGGGYLHTYIKQKMQKESHLTVYDFSTHMVQRSAARFKKSLTQHTPGSLDTLTKEELESIKLDDPLFQQFNYHPVVGSVEDLSHFKDNTFDAYMSNLCFQLINDWQKAINEAYRVLQPGGKIGFSVWGQQQNCETITIFLNSLADAGLASNFMVNSKFLDDKQIVINMVKKAGFTDILCWVQQAPFDILDVNDFNTFVTPDVQNILCSANENQKQLFHQAFKKRIDMKKEKHDPFKFECIMLIASKPK